MNKLKHLLAACLLLASYTATAMDLQDAKDQGLVGEAPSGYLEAVTSPSAEVRELIDSINAKRKQHYRKIASNNNTSLATVEKLAGEKAMEKSRPGHYIKPAGQWKRK